MLFTSLEKNIKRREHVFSKPKFLLKNAQYKVLVPLRVERPGLVAGVEPGQGVAGEVEGAEGVAAAGHVLAQEVAGRQDLQVGLQVRLLRE